MASHVFATRPCSFTLEETNPPLLEMKCSTDSKCEKKKTLASRGVYKYAPLCKEIWTLEWKVSVNSEWNEVNTAKEKETPLKVHK